MSLKDFLTKEKTLNNQSFGMFVHQRREELGLTMRYVCDQLQISSAYLCDIENGNRTAPCKVLNEMIEVLKIDNNDKLDFLDLAYLSHNTCAPDLIEYLIANKSARNKIRKEINKPTDVTPITESTSTSFNPNNLTFGEFIRCRREELGISLREVAKFVGISAAYLHEVEIGTKHAVVKHLTKLKHCLEIPFEHEKDFDDLAYLSYNNCARYITDYMLESREARLAIRYLVENNITGADFLDIVQSNVNFKEI